MAKTMIASMTDGQIENFVDKFRASLRKHRDEILLDVAQQVCGVENLGMECYAVVRKHADRLRNIVRLTISSVKEFVQPSWMKQLKGNDPLEPGDYTYTFEEFLQEGEGSVVGDEMVRRAKAKDSDSGLQAALYLLGNQHLISEEYRGKKYLIFAGAEALDADDDRRVTYLGWSGGRWVLDWRWLSCSFRRGGLLVRARKS